VPRKIGRDEAAERRTDHRAEQSGHGDPCHRVDERALVDGPQQHQAADRHHHRAAHALKDAGEDEVGERARERTADRAKHENGDGGCEHVARAEPVRHPAAAGDEHRQRQQIGGNRDLQRQRIGADIGRDGGQRRRNDRRVHVFHKQGAGDDQRNQAFFLHLKVGSNGRRIGKARLMEKVACAAGEGGPAGQLAVTAAVPARGLSGGMAAIA